MTLTIWWKVENYEEAIIAYDNAIALSPTNYQAWRDKALSLRELKRYNESFSTLNTILKIFPDNPELWNKKGEIHLALGQINEANEAFAMAKSLIERN